MPHDHPPIPPDSLDPFRLRVLGTVSVTGAGGETPLVTQPRHLAVCGYLSVARPRGFHARESIMALCWPEMAPSAARHALRNVLHGLRLKLGSHAIRAAGDELVAVEPTRLTCDLFDLEAALASGAIDDVVALYSGPFMRGFGISGAPDLDDWIDRERREWHDRVTAAIGRAHQEAIAQEDFVRALFLVRHAATLLPDDEGVLRRLLECQFRIGDRAGALRSYEEFAARLRRDFDQEPALETVELVMRGRGPRAAPIAAAIAPDAYVDYVRGHYLFLRAAPGGHPEELHRSREFFEAALDRSPDFAPAYAGLSNYYAVAAMRNVLRPFEEYFAKTIALSHQALALDPGLAIPHVHFGVQAMYLDDDWSRAGEEFADAVRLEPGYAEGHRFFGIHAEAMGRFDEAIAAHRAATEAEPHIALFRNSLAAALMLVGQYHEATVELRKALTLHPGYGPARDRLIRCCEAIGDFETALAVRSAAAPESAARFVAAFQEGGAEGYRAARRLELKASVGSLTLKVAVSPPADASDRVNPLELRLALACMELGDHDAAQGWEERACQHRPGRRQWFRHHPGLKGLST